MSEISRPECADKTSSQEQAVLASLRCLAPPATILHIGAGTGTGALAVWREWGIESAFVFDADDTRLGWARIEGEGRSWHVAGVLLDSDTVETDYYVASDPDESGLLDPSGLSDVLPDLLTQSKQQRLARSLNHYLGEIGQTISSKAGPVWAFLDCFPAIRILIGCGNELKDWSVIVLRVLLGQQPDSLFYSSYVAANEFLMGRGFCCVHFIHSTHQNVAHAIFVKNWPMQLKSAHQTSNKLQSIEAQHLKTLVNLATTQQQLDETKQRHVHLETRLAETSMWKELLQEELLKAEDQMARIKDLLRREPGL